MSCRLVHNTKLSLISVLLESLGGGVISFSSVPMLFSPLSLSGMVYQLNPSNGAGIFRQLNADPLTSPANGANWHNALVMAGWANAHILSANHLWIVPPQWSAITLLTPCLYKILRNPSESHPGLLCETGSWCVSAPCNSLCHLHTERPSSCFATVAL